MQGGVLGAAAAFCHVFFLFGAGLGGSSGASASDSETELEEKSSDEMCPYLPACSEQPPSHSPQHVYPFKNSNEEATSERGLRRGPQAVLGTGESAKASMGPGGESRSQPEEK